MKSDCEYPPDKRKDAEKIMNEHEKIKNAIRNVPVIDSHEHLTPDTAKRIGLDLIDACTRQYLCHDLLSSGMPLESVSKLSDPAIPAAQKAALLFPWLDYVKTTGYGQLMQAALEQLEPGLHLTPETAAHAEALYDEYVTDQPLKKYLQSRTKIRCCIVDWMPLDWRFDDPFYIQAYNPLFLVIPENEARIQKLGVFTGIRIHSLMDYLQAVRHCIEKKYREQDVRVLKLSIAYHRNLCFRHPSMEAAAREYHACMERALYYRGGLSAGLGFDACTAFQDAVLHTILQTAEALHMTVQLHTGYMAGNFGDFRNGDPSTLIPVFKEYSGVCFDLFHMSYPYEKEAGLLAKMYPNVYVNLCWSHVLSPQAVVQTLTDWLQLVPLNKIIGFGADTSVGFDIPAHLELAYRNLEKVFCRLADDGIWTADDASDAAYRLLYDNPIKLYQLETPERK